MNKIIFADADGGINIVSPSLEYQTNILDLAAQVVPPGQAYRVLQDSQFPADRTYRPAWVFDFDDPDAVVVIDSVKVAEINRSRIPKDVSVWQFMMAAWKMGFVTQTDALVAVKDKIMPPAFADALADLPAEKQAEAQIKFAGITRMLRSDPLFALVIGAGIATGAQIDAVFTVADDIQ